MSDKNFLFRACDFSGCVYKFACGASTTVACESAMDSISLIIILSV